MATFFIQQIPQTSILHYFLEFSRVTFPESIIHYDALRHYVNVAKKHRAFSVSDFRHRQLVNCLPPIITVVSFRQSKGTEMITAIICLIL